MTKKQTKQTSPQKTPEKNRLVEIVNTFEWLITAFILAFVFRAFIMEAYRIPTGSMADTLMGAHFRLQCSQCGYKYEYGFTPEKYGFNQNHYSTGHLRLYHSRCPSCGYFHPTGGNMRVSNGDRILVLKCVYQFFEPKQWDVVVFKNPLEPSINYIKRLIGRPGETIEIIDGDIYIDGKISRKPTKVQDELWMSVYDNDYQPARPTEGTFNKKRTWQQPLRNIENSKWYSDKDHPAVFNLNSKPDDLNYLLYDTSLGNNFRTAYAYNEVERFDYMPFCSDLMVRFYAASKQQHGKIGIALTKYETEYKAYVDLTGKMVIARFSKNGSMVVLARKDITITNDHTPVLVKFANVDHQLIFQYGDKKLTYDLGLLPDDAGQRKTDTEPKAKIFAAGKLTLSHIAVFRDIHYTEANGPGYARATEGNPFKLDKDQFFMLGDNSPNSADSRWWPRPGIGNNKTLYRQGIVPREYLVGKALFVYWPNGFKLFGKDPLGMIPNIGKIRFIYGGADKKS